MALTPDERAEKIVFDFMGQTLSSNQDVDDWLRSRIADEIKAAVEEAESEFRNEIVDAACNESKAIQIVKAQAFEEAAKLAERYGHGVIVMWNSTDIAAAIRALAKGVK